MDVLGSRLQFADTRRNALQRNEYEPYGKVLAPTAPDDGPGYTGHVFDAATGMNYMQQRYYDPDIGRFLSVDPVTTNSGTEANFNRYWYANNNPYKFLDPDGRLGCTGTRIKSVCDSGGAAELQTSARSSLDTGRNKQSSSSGPSAAERVAPQASYNEDWFANVDPMEIQAAVMNWEEWASHLESLDSEHFHWDVPAAHPQFPLFGAG
ncbi:RHS repeat-associated core domain-containing protein [Lysobacter sp. 22409]|uniref:RHS repeat-associated core domain-containing protein n=1 Tax=Lysobacter sp. 22409 TaxID=3453917 RepID=UPI003F829BFD